VRPTVAEHTPKLVMGDIVCIGPDGEEGIPYDEAVIHLEGDEDSEIRINCPGALRLAPTIVKAVNNHDALVGALENAHCALTALKEAIEASRSMNGREYIGLGIQTNNAIDRAYFTLRDVVGGQAK
jgi:hypothetical protein